MNLINLYFIKNFVLHQIHLAKALVVLLNLIEVDEHKLCEKDNDYGGALLPVHHTKLMYNSLQLKTKRGFSP